MTKSYQKIWLHQFSPLKPPYGAPCNGCGVCCAITPCPLARARFIRFWRFLPDIAPCPALQWVQGQQRYECGLLVSPDQFWRWIPSSLRTLWLRGVRRWIAAGIGCDSTTEVETPVQENSAR